MTMRQLHTGLGWAVGLWLALLCLSGSVLLFQYDLLRWQYPQLEHVDIATRPADWAQVLQQLQQAQQYQYVRLPTDAAPWLEALTLQGSRHYMDVHGQPLLQRNPHADWIDWVYDFHTSLLLGHNGSYLLGAIGVLSILMLITGLSHWWPARMDSTVWQLKRSRNRLRNWRQWHSVPGVLIAPLLLVLIFSGIVQVFSTPLRTLLGPTASLAPPALPRAHQHPLQATDWFRALTAAQQAVPEGEIRFISLRQRAEQPIKLRIRNPGEWHPNGRSVLYIAPDDGTILTYRPATDLPTARQFINLMFPIHTAAVGGVLYVTLAGLAGLLGAGLFLTGVMYFITRKRFRRATGGRC